MSNIKKNISYNLMYRLITLVIPLITSPYISRVLGPENVGIFSYTNSVAYYFFIFAMLGVNNYGNRAIAKNKDDKKKLSQTFWQIYYIQLILSMILSVMYLIFISLVNRNNILVAYIQVLYVFSAALDINWFIYGMEEFKIATIRSSIMKVLVAISFFVFVKEASDIWIYTLIVQVGNIISLIVIWPLVKKYTYFCKPNPPVIISHLKPNLILFLPYIASGLYIYMDKVMLGVMAENAEIGYYQYAENIINIPMLLTVAVGTVMLPRLSNLVKSKKNSNISDILEKSFITICWINIGMFFGLMAISEKFIPWFLGSNYIRSAELIEILSVIIVLNGMCEVIRTHYMIPNELDRQYSISIIFGAIINLLVNAMLISKYGANGAAIASVMAYTCMFVFQCISTRKNIRYIFLLKKIFPYIIIGLIMFYAVELFGNLKLVHIELEIITQIFGGSVVYILISYFYQIVVQKCTNIIETRRKV